MDIEAYLPITFALVHYSYIVRIRHLNKIQDNQIHIGDMQITIGEKFRDGLMERTKRPKGTNDLYDYN
jgi:hypothetical protein